MNSLVAYDSSDEEDDDVQPEKPAKIAKTEPLQKTNIESTTAFPIKSKNNAQYTASHSISSVEHPGPTTGPTAGPAPLSSSILDAKLQDDDTIFPPPSPYTYERQRLRDLTMPTVPNFDIPDSPPPPPSNSEEAAVLAATTKKFEKFLELKSRGVHFNQRLQNSSSLQNPSLLPKLMEFAGISREESYASSLPEGCAIPVKWPEECYATNLVKQNEKNEKKRLAQKGGGGRREFVPSSENSKR